LKLAFGGSLEISVMFPYVTWMCAFFS
jgi:hypothetical protein